MIYVKDYQALNQLVNQNNSLSYRQQLPSLIGKPITVFVDGGGVCGRGFTGVLLKVLTDSITLITALPPAVQISTQCLCKKQRDNKFGTCTTIPLEHITAINYNFI